MQKLRLLQINNVHLTGKFEHLSRELRWLCWHYCPLKNLPSNFQLKNLVALDLQYSNIKQLWPDSKVNKFVIPLIIFNYTLDYLQINGNPYLDIFSLIYQFVKNLRVLNLSHCKFLTRTPNFTGLPRMEILLLESCLSLLEIHHSIGVLDRLTSLSLKDCGNLTDLPSSICNLISLQHLNLTDCSNLKKLPKLLGNMHCLRELHADGTAIKQLPFSCRFLKNLTILSLGRCNNNLPSKSWLPLIMSWVSPRRNHDFTGFLPPSISGLCSLRKLILRHCNLNEASIPIDIGSLSALQLLDLGSNNFHSLPSSLCQLSKLDSLWLDDCKNLRSINELPPNLRVLQADACTSLEKLPNLSNYHRLEKLFLANCNRFADIQDSRNLDSMRFIHWELSNILINAIKDSELEGHCKDDYYSIFIPVGKIPEWYIHQRMGSSISFNMPFHVGNKLIALTTWAVCAAKEGVVTTALFHVLYNKTNGVEQILRPTVRNNIPVTQTEHSLWSIIPALEFFPIKGGERMELSIKISPFVDVKKCGVHFLYKPDIRESQQGQLSSAKTIVQDYVHPKRSRDVDLKESGNNLEEKDGKRLRIEPDST
ncbi:unnamed protein product [Ilex paraguariensis]|uniref:Uncharacterized protein n=1 Tax=Ilex paraguariensis TaxID=185542 RepID=A0ABC8U9K8_9AQUA